MWTSKYFDGEEYSGKIPLDCQSWWQLGEGAGSPPCDLNNGSGDAECNSTWKRTNTKNNNNNNKRKVDNSIATWKSFLSENSRRRLCHRGCVVARIAEVAEYWWLIINEIINFQLKMENTKQNWNTQIHPHGPVHIGWGFLSHVPHAPQLVQTCVKKTKFNKGHFQRMRNHHVERKCPKDNFQRV